MISNDAVDQATDWQKFEKDFTVDDPFAPIRVMKLRLFDEKPVCHNCGDSFTHIDQATLWEPARGKPVLVCQKMECKRIAFSAALFGLMPVNFGKRRSA
jgi:hypothetical protein